MAALLMFGCAQGGPPDPAGSVDVGVTSPDAGPPADSGPGAAGGGPAQGWPCNPSIDARAGTAIADTGACPGVMPAAATCAADIVLCSGGGAGGSETSAATGDGRGSVALSCHRTDVGPSAFTALFVPMGAGFVSKAPLGVEAWGMDNGFVTFSPARPSGSYRFVAHDGTELAERSSWPSKVFVGRSGAVMVRAESGAVVAQAFGRDGSPGPAHEVARVDDVSSLIFGGAMDVGGSTLALWQIYGQTQATAVWLSADGAPSSALFSIAGWLDFLPPAAALAGGGVAIPGLPQSGTNEVHWRGVIAAGATVERPPAAWLASRGAFRLLPTGKAMAFGNEIVAPDGTVCGTLDLGAPIIGIGVDGTTITARDPRTFRIYPQLVR